MQSLLLKLTMGKHVYCQKPHTLFMNRLLNKLAAEYKVASQMGNQRFISEGVNLVCEWIGMVIWVKLQRLNAAQTVLSGHKD